MVSYDVTALFTNTPIPDTLHIIRERFDSDATLSDRTTLSVDSIMGLLTFCLNTIPISCSKERSFAKKTVQPWDHLSHH